MSCKVNCNKQRSSQQCASESGDIAMIRMFRELCSAILCVTLMIVPFSEVTQARRALPYSRSFASEARATPTPASRSALGKAASSGPIRAAAAASPQSSSAFQLPGQSFTPLPDGRWLVLGGYGGNGPVDTAWVVDPSQATATKLSNSLLHSRAFHTATLLPDGTVLIVGGVDGAGGLEGPVGR